MSASGTTATASIVWVRRMAKIKSAHPTPPFEGDGTDLIWIGFLYDLFYGPELYRRTGGREVNSFSR